MTTQKYLCPPRLQKKFLLWWWTVPELIGIALGAVLVFYLRSPQIFTLTCFLALGTARFDFENNLFGALKMRTAYQFFTKTFSQNAASGKDEKRRKKKLRRLMKSKLPMQELLQFRFGENGIYGGKDGKELFRFYRYYPPNTDVLTDGEIAEEIEQLCRLFDSLRCPFVMFGTDKVEDMSALKAYYRSQPRQYDHIIADVINEIESTEARSSAVQRAYYFIYKAQNEDDDIYTLIAGKGYKVDRVKNEELAVLLRNYLVREFTNVDLYTIAEEVKNYPDMVRAKPAVYNKEIMRRLCPNRIDFTKDHAEQSGVLRRTLMIKNFPSQIPPRALYMVASMRNTSFTMRLTPLQKDSARKLINEQLRNKAVMAGKHQATEQIDAMQEANDIQNFYSEITRNQNTVYSINIYIEIYGKTLDELNDLEQQVKIELAGAGITYDQLAYEQRDAFSSVQPLGSDRFLLCSNNLPSAGEIEYRKSNNSSWDVFPEGSLDRFREWAEQQLLQELKKEPLQYQEFLEHQSHQDDEIEKNPLDMEDAARQAGLTVQRDQDKPGAAYFDADQNVIHVSDAGSEEDVRLSELKGYADAVIQRTATVEQPVRDLESASLAVMLAARYDVGVSDRLSQQLASAHAEAVKCPTFDLPVTLQRLDKALDYCDHFLAHEQERALEQEAENEPEPEQVTELSPQSQAFMMDL